MNAWRKWNVAWELVDTKVVEANIQTCEKVNKCCTESILDRSYNRSTKNFKRHSFWMDRQDEERNSSKIPEESTHILPQGNLENKVQEIRLKTQTESDSWSDHSHPEATSDQVIPIRKWPLIRPFPSGSDLWSGHSHPQVTYDQTIPIRNRNLDPVIMIWEHTMCVGLRMIRGHFRMAPQPGSKWLYMAKTQPRTLILLLSTEDKTGLVE